MALFDRLIADDDATKVIDLGHESVQVVFSVAHQIGFVEEARRAVGRRGDSIRGDARPNFGRRLSQPARPLSRRQRWRQCTMSCWDRRSTATNITLAGGGAVIVHLPALAPGLRRYIETPPILICKFDIWAMRSAYRSTPYRAATLATANLSEFRELDLRILLADLQSSIRLECNRHEYRSSWKTAETIFSNIGNGACLRVAPPDSRAGVRAIGGGTPCGLRYFHRSSASPSASAGGDGCGIH